MSEPVFPLPVPQLVLQYAHTGLLPLAFYTNDRRTEILEQEDVLAIFKSIASFLSEGGTGALRVCAMTLARRVDMREDWHAACRAAGIRVVL